jgi:hypothetical protein
MGACSFVELTHGKTARDAFSAAVDRAQWEFGHGGYTGTIAEKGDFTVYDLPPRIAAEKVVSMLDASYGRDASEPSQYRANARKAWKWLTDTFGEQVARGMESLYHDKWGPAIGFVVTGKARDRYRLYNHVPRGHKVYLFAGYASE